VFSTTFASLSRTFRCMGVDSIPWLLVDEAGQSVPHQAAGGIWRARRAIVVGDPFQVEPIVTLDRNADAKLAERRGVPERLRATLSSAQTLADGANRYGAWITGRRGRPVWVGCPLTVHRRCVEPMFSISNRLAYAGSMVLGDGKLEAEAKLTERRPLLGPSAWIDVAVKTGGPKHFITEQADVVRSIVRSYLDHGLVGDRGLPMLYVVSPFRSMADGLRSALVRDLKALRLPEQVLAAWAAASIGTVHTFQGKQRETVVLALGGTSDGAIRWASATPNILNVAVTRAQRRLYVVGDRLRWMTNELVADLAEIETVPLDEARRRFGLTEWPPAAAAQSSVVRIGGRDGMGRRTLI
jgi:superfamily I DNA and/or RNA helicase